MSTHRKSQSLGALVKQQGQGHPGVLSNSLAWLNANKSAMFAVAALSLVAYAVLFPHPERGPREIAQEIMPSKTAVSDIKGMPRDSKEWMGVHEQYVTELVQHANKGGLDLVFYGDSLTECWRGTRIGLPHDKFRGIPEAWAAHFGGLQAAAFGISGDTTDHLYWRITNGEGPKAVKPKVIVVLIGTNDLKDVSTLHDREGVSTGVGAGNVAVLEALMAQSPGSRIILVGLLPRGDRHVEAPALAFLQPSRYTPIIEAINEKLEAFAQLNTRVEFLDCGDRYLEDDDKVENAKRLKRELMPDALHPNAAGMELYIECLRPSITKWGLKVE